VRIAARLEQDHTAASLGKPCGNGPSARAGANHKEVALGRRSLIFCHLWSCNVPLYASCLACDQYLANCDVYLIFSLQVLRQWFERRDMAPFFELATKVKRSIAAGSRIVPVVPLFSAASRG